MHAEKSDDVSKYRFWALGAPGGAPYGAPISTASHSPCVGHFLARKWKINHFPLRAPNNNYISFKVHVICLTIDFLNEIIVLLTRVKKPSEYTHVIP